MIKVTSITGEGYTEEGYRLVKASLVSDTAEEVADVTTGDDIDGLTENDHLTLGSTCLVANGDFGILNSSGVWTF